MREIKLELGHRSYPIYIGRNLIFSTELYKRLIHADQVMVVTNSLVEKLYLPGLVDSLTDFNVMTHIVPDGEIHKNLESMNRIITDLLTNRFSRTGYIIALGGGVIGDLAGFTAACYQRGIKFIQAPTTLLAQVDSSVGGKTAVNHPLGKNMIGAFYQPCAVISDTSVLESLPEREFISGLAELIKYGVINDSEFYEWIEDNLPDIKNRKSDKLEFAIERSCLNKAEVVSDDERESGRRAILNFGHTFAHAIETGLDYKHWLHGEAVGLGMLMAAHMSMRMGWFSQQQVERLYKLIHQAGLPVNLPVELADTDLRGLMSVDKKVSYGKLKMILLKEIGEAVITDEFDESVLQETIDYFRARSN